MGAGEIFSFSFSKDQNQDLALNYQIGSIQGCFKTEWSDGGVGNGTRERSVGDGGEVRGDACVRCAGFHPPYKFLLFGDAGGISDASGAVFEAEKVRLSEKLWFHRSCFTCKACRGFLDVLRCGDNEDGYDDGNIDDIVDESDGLLPTPPTTQVDHWSRWGGVL